MNTNGYSKLIPSLRVLDGWVKKCVEISTAPTPELSQQLFAQWPNSTIVENKTAQTTSGDCRHVNRVVNDQLSGIVSDLLHRTQLACQWCTMYCASYQFHTQYSSMHPKLSIGSIHIFRNLQFHPGLYSLHPVRDYQPNWWKFQHKFLFNHRVPGGLEWAYYTH